jgi:hypothetical protein
VLHFAARFFAKGERRGLAEKIWKRFQLTLWQYSQNRHILFVGSAELSDLIKISVEFVK